CAFWRQKRDYVRALADCNEALRLDPTFTLSFWNRGVIRAEQHEFDRALADHNEALRIDPKFNMSLVERDKLLKIRQDWDKATEAIRVQSTIANAFVDLTDPYSQTLLEEAKASAIEYFGVPSAPIRQVHLRLRAVGPSTFI